MFISVHSFSANRYWVGSGSGNWSSSSNWSNSSEGSSGFSVPSFLDNVFFEGGNTTNCTIDANLSVNGFNISSLYTGTISLNSGISTTVAAAGFSQSGGTFTGNNANISINGPFSLAGGNFTSTTAILQITSNFTNSTGTFNHNNGMVTFSTSQIITGNTMFYDVLFIANGGIYTIASGTTISSSNNVIINGTAACTINTGTLAIKKNLTLTSTTNNSINGGSATFLFDGAGVQNITSATSAIIIGTNEKVCALPNIEINKLSGSLNLSGLINLSGTSWKTTSGATLINSGTSTVNINSSVTFTGQNISLYDIHIYANSQLITPSPATYVLTSTNNVIINGGSYYQLNTGTLEILGDLTLFNSSTSAVNGGTGTFLFDGTGTQNINSSISSLNNVCALPKVVISKSTGALNLNGIINISGSSWNTVAGASLINPGTSVINLLASTTLSGQDLSLYDISITGNFNTISISSGLVWTSTHLITLAGGSSWYQINTGTLNAKGDVLVTNINTSNNVGGNAVLLFDGAADQTLTGSAIAGGGRLPKVRINKSGGTLTLQSNTISTDNEWTYIQGTVDANTYASTVDFYKTSVIDGQGTSASMAFYNVIFSGFISLGGNMDINGDFKITSGVNNRLDVTSSNYQINLAGNWTNNNSVTTLSFNQQSGKVVFDGGNAQSLTLTSNTHKEIYYNLELNKNSNDLTLNAPVTVSNNVNFIAGNIVSSLSNILLLNNAVTATGANNSSFVTGPVRKTGNQGFIFPVGKNSVYAPISITAPTLNTNQFTAEYFESDPDISYNVLSKDASLDHISRCEYWILNRTTGTSNVKVTLSWDTRSCGINNLSELAIARWDGSRWQNEGNGGTTGSSTSGTLITSSVINAFSPFTIASTTLANPLPIELISFTGECNNWKIELKWSTASEINSDYFTLESSKDAINWGVIGSVQGAGSSSNIQDYSLVVAQPYTGLAYFRLKQTDFNGDFEYFKIIALKECQSDLSESDLIIYPNPSNGLIYLVHEGDNGQFVSIHIYNSMGERIYESAVYQPHIDLTTMPDGIYFLHFTSDSKSIIKKIILKR